MLLNSSATLTLGQDSMQRTHEMVVAEAALVLRVRLQEHRALYAVNVLAVIPGALRAACGTLLCSGQALHGQLPIPGAVCSTAGSFPIFNCIRILDSGTQLHIYTTAN